MMPEFDQLQNISGVEEIDLDCIDYETLPRTQVIQSDSVYRNVLTPLVGHNPYCELDTLPVIDFDEHTLAWAITHHETVEKVILKEGNTLTYLFKAKTSTFPIGQFRMNAITIPKLNVTDTVIFSTVIYGCEVR
jgi:hypothetical protein